MGNIVKVGMADLKALRHPAVLTTLGLGSCVGIALIDMRTNIIGLAHAMLPDSLQINNRSNTAVVDTAIDELIAEMGKLGTVKAGIVAKLAGEHRCFPFHNLRI